MDTKYLLFYMFTCALKFPTNEATTTNRVDVTTILVCGRSGAGISSTIRHILGSATLLNLANDQDNANVTIFETKLLGSSSILRFIDVAGIIDGRSGEDDDTILQSLTSYLQSLQQENPSSLPIFLLVSHFHDSRYADEQSDFVRMLRKIRSVQESIFNDEQHLNGLKHVLLFNRLMAEIKTIQRRPGEKLASFRTIASRIIGVNGRYVVGENMGVDYELEMNTESMLRLPNKEYYPLNVLAALAMVTGNGSIEQRTINEFIARRNNSVGYQTQQIVVERKNYFPQNQTSYPEEQFATEMTTETSTTPVIITPRAPTIYARSNTTFIPNFDSSNLANITNCTASNHNQITIALCRAIAASNISTPFFPNLLNFFKSANITTYENLPESRIAKINFFQQLGQLVELVHVQTIVEQALNLVMPHFESNPVIGSGYDVLSDELQIGETSSPFVITDFKNWVPSSMGVLLPPHIIVEKMRSSDNLVYFREYKTTVSDAFKARLVYLNDTTKLLENYNTTLFEGQLLPGFNLAPNSAEIPTLSTSTTWRTYKFTLKKDKASEFPPFTPQFIADVRSLTPFNSSIKSSVKEWKDFFRTYGSHVVTGAFAGGSIQGTLFSSTINQPESILKLISQFRYNLEENLILLYRVFGGRSNNTEKLASLHKFNQTEQISLLSEWETSLQWDPIVLKYELELAPLSKLVRKVRPDAGNFTRRALSLLLKGELVYERPVFTRKSTRKPISQSSPYGTVGINTTLRPIPTSRPAQTGSYFPTTPTTSPWQPTSYQGSSETYTSHYDPILQTQPTLSPEEEDEQQMHESILQNMQKSNEQARGKLLMLTELLATRQNFTEQIRSNIQTLQLQFQKVVAETGQRAAEERAILEERYRGLSETARRADQDFYSQQAELDRQQRVRDLQQYDAMQERSRNLTLQIGAAIEARDLEEYKNRPWYKKAFGWTGLV